MDPNLLPQNLRAKELKEQERLKKQPRGSVLELHKPQKENSAVNLADSDKPKAGLWQKIFGVSNKQIANASVLSSPNIDRGQDYGMDWLAKNPNRRLPKVSARSRETARSKASYIRKQPRGGWLGSWFGKPVSPILPVETAKALEPAIEELAAPKHLIETKKETPPLKLPELKPRPSSDAFAIAKRAKPGKNISDSWWSILLDLFGSSRKREERLKFASIDGKPGIDRSESKRPISVKEKDAKKTPAKDKSSKSARFMYNLAPKREKTEINVNLMPQELKAANQIASFLDLRIWVLSILIPILLVTGFYFLVIYLQSGLEKEMSLKQQELTQLNQQIGDFVVKEKQNNTIAQKVSTIKKLSDEKIVWSRFFELLEKYTLDGVYFTSLTADTSGILILPGIADNYNVLAQQLAVLEKAGEFVKDVKISNTQLYSEGKAGVLGSSFQIRLVLQDGIFKRAK